MWYKEKVVRFYDLDGNLIEVRKSVRLEGKIYPASQRTSIPLTLHLSRGCRHMNGKIQA